METVTVDLPALYGDHHVLEVRRLLFALPGVEDVYASSAFRAAEVTFDPARVDVEAITATLDRAGYLGELMLPAETGNPATDKSGGPTFFRHTQAYEDGDGSVSFKQQVPYSGRPLWPCPGLGTLSTRNEGE